MKPLAVQLYSVRRQLAADPAATLRRLAGIGYRSVELHRLDQPAAGLTDLALAAGLNTCAAHANLRGEHGEAALANAAAWGIDTVIVASVPAEEFADRSGVTRTARFLNDTAARAARFGLRLGYHNHHWELSSRIAGRPALEVLADQLAPEVLLEIDVYWAAVGGVDVPDLLARLGDRVEYLHVKDGPARPGDPMTAVGAGALPVPEVLAAAPAGAWPVVELDRCATDMFDALSDSYTYLHGLRQEVSR